MKEIIKILHPVLMYRVFFKLYGDNMNSKIKNLTVCAVFGVIGFILMLLEFPVSFIMPSFIKFDFSDLPALIAAFALGPFYGVTVSLIKNLLHLFISSSAGIGELSNFILGAVFSLVAGFFYKYNKSRKGALIACLLGSIAMGIICIPENYYIVYPLYIKILHFPMEEIIKAYSSILNSADSLIKSLVIFNLPFTFIKGLIDSVICFIIYKKISPIIK